MTRQKAQQLQPLEIRHLTYSALPWQTHPIDIASGSQGWGPFKGPWTPLDFASPAMAMGNGGIDITYNSGDNRVRLSPPYQVATIYRDNATSFVNNRAGTGAFQPAGIGTAYAPGASTITQGRTARAVNPSDSRLGGALKYLQTIFHKG